MSRLINIEGLRFGRLTVLTRAQDAREAMWLCRCECGAETVAQGSGLRSGKRVSCGCTKGDARATHRLSADPIYKVWSGMMSRCYDSRAAGFKNYGGRGISVCDAWRESPAQVLADMGPRPPGMTMERKDSNGDYSPTNCIWASHATQARNRRTNRRITINGETLCLMDWCARFGLHYSTAATRLRSGMSPELAVTTPTDTRYSRA